MKTVTTLIASLLLTVAMASVSYACLSWEPACGKDNSINLIDKVIFTSTGLHDDVDSRSNNVNGEAEYKGSGGITVNALESASGNDYLKWIHNYNFSPQVQNPGGIKSAFLYINLVNFKSKTDEHGKEYGDRNHEHDDKDNDEYEDEENKILKGREKEKRTVKGKEEDKITKYDIDLSCLKKIDDKPSAIIQLDGTSEWYNIPSVSGSSSFDLLLTQLYDGSFGVEIKSKDLDFEIVSSTLSIDYCPAPVPEPSTIVLLGAGLIGAGLIRRRMRK